MKSSSTNRASGKQPSIEERLHAVIDRAYSQVQFPYIFHCEDDWEFFRPGFIKESFILLDALSNASTIMLRGRERNRALIKTPLKEINGIRFCQLQPNYHKTLIGSSYNPGLRRLADYQKQAPLTKIKGGEAEVSYKFLLLGFTTAHLEIPAVAHIGWEQQTRLHITKKTFGQSLRKKWMRLHIQAHWLVVRVKKSLPIRFFIKALLYNPNIFARQMMRRFYRFRELVTELSAERPISIFQVGANDPLGELILNGVEKIRALLIEPQRTAYSRLSQRYRQSPHVTCLNAAIDKEPGSRTMYSIEPQAVAQKTGRILDDSIGSFDRQFVGRYLKRRLRNARPALSDFEVEALITEETVPTMTLKQAMEEAGILQPDVFLVDTEGFDGEIFWMALDAGLRPTLIQYEHKHLTADERQNLSEPLMREGYQLWADRSDVWGQKHRD